MPALSTNSLSSASALLKPTPAAVVNHRALGLINHVGGLLHGLHILLIALDDLDGSLGLKFAFIGSDVLGNINKDGAFAASIGDAEGVPNNIRQFFHFID